MEKFVISNSSKNSIKIILEPWVEERLIASDSFVEIEFTGTSASPIEIEYIENGITVYFPAGLTAKMA